MATRHQAERRRGARSERKRAGRRHPERAAALSAPPEPAPPPPRTISESEADERVRGFLHERFGAEASRLRLMPLAGDASMRRYYRLQDDDDTVIAVYPEPIDSEQNPFVVVRHLMAGWGIPVPEILAVDGARGVLLLEDLGDLTLKEILKTASAETRAELYRQALDQLVRLQAESGRGQQRAVCFQIAFDFEKLSWELHLFLKNFLEA